MRGFVESFAELGNRRFSVVERGRECSQDENARNKQNELFFQKQQCHPRSNEEMLGFGSKEFLEY